MPKSLPFEQHQVIQLKIDRLSFGGGRGVGRHEGVVVFVPLTVSGDFVECEITELKKNHAVARLTKIIEPSQYRREAPCKYFGACGGCSWQNVNYSEQIAQKKSFFERTLEQSITACSAEMIEAPSEFGYRNRIQIHKKNGSIGFFEKGSNNLIAIENCKIAEPDLNVALAKITAADFGHSDRLELALNEGGDLKKIKGRPSPGDHLFSQVNTKQNLVLRKLVCEMAKEMTLENRPEQIIDLFCGRGNLSFPLAEQFPGLPVIGIELSRAMVDEARQNNKLSNLKYVASAAESYCSAEKLTSSTLVILDPPRTGAPKAVLNWLLNEKVAGIIYISCHLANLQRDLKHLKQSYKVTRAVGVDMFPQTDYLESVVALTRR